MDVLILARMQFAARITLHMFFPTIGIAPAWMLPFFRARARHAERRVAGRPPRPDQGVRIALRARDEVQCDEWSERRRRFRLRGAALALT